MNDYSYREGTFKFFLNFDLAKPVFRCGFIIKDAIFCFKKLNHFLLMPCDETVFALDKTTP